MSALSHQRPEKPVLVVDFGAQYAQLIARRVREAHVYSEIVSPKSAEELLALNPQGIILSGGPSSVYAEGAPSIDPKIYESNIPILGICYGAQLIAKDLGGKVSKTNKGEYGRTSLVINKEKRSELFNDFPDEIEVWMSHSDAISEVPPGFALTSSTKLAPVASFENSQMGIYGTQFHPEVVHSQLGQELLKSFLFNVCDAKRNWTSISVIDNAVQAIKEQVKGGKVLCALSGGVDSAVAAALVHKAVGDQLTCVFVDTGLMRSNEGIQVERAFERDFNVDLVHIKAEDRFLESLSGVTDPETKRKTIGELFIRIFEEVARDHSDAKFLVQGTLYPDVVESGEGESAVIKSHHNVGGLPEDMDLELVEPLRLLFKDEVRAIGSELGLPDEITWRQPFPGPGLAVRIIGEVTRERTEILRKADAIVVEEIHKYGLDRELWQYFAVLPAIRSVGVMGDGRTYAYPVIIRAVTSEDAMTADWARLPYEVLEVVSSRLISEVPGINRVAYDITSKPPGTIEWE
ncbi:MAG: glutamine-hydrolyzing GMP synthase [Acidimicrobiales bacterium]|nr:glutamine-hydrolyzing GMP synthase [Acidimicrobiales bacterium]